MYFNLVVTAAFTVPVVATGLVAWQWTLEGQKLKGIFLQHMLFDFAHLDSVDPLPRAARHAEEFLPRYRLPIEAIAVLLLGLTGHLGGFSQ